MDDFHGCAKRSEAEHILENVSTLLKVKKSAPILTGKYAHLKRVRVRTESGTFVGADPSHLVGVAQLLGVENSPAPTPYVEGDEPPPEKQTPLGDEQKATYKTCVGTFLYIAGDRMDMQKEIGELATNLQDPTDWDFKELVRVARYGAGTATYGNWLPRPESAEPVVIHLTQTVDTDHAGDRKTRRSLTCGQVTADGCPLLNFVRRQTIISLSSGESEFCGMHQVNLEGVCLKNLFEWLGFRIYWTTRSDSSAARAMALREGCGRIRHLDSRLVYTQFLVKEHRLHISVIKGTENPTDLGTKRHPVKKFLELRTMCGVLPEPDITGLPEVEVAHVEQSCDSHFKKFVETIAEAMMDFVHR